jgi:DNA-binding CsgD family transcriptional regulator
LLTKPANSVAETAKTTSNLDHGAGGTDRLLETLQRLLGIQAPKLRPALDQASSLVAEALDADKVDVFLHEPESDTLVAMGTSDTTMGHEQHRAGLNRQPIANNGPSVTVFETGTPYLSGAADRDPAQLVGMVRRLGVRSEMDVALDVNGQRRGIVQAASRESDFFTERDLHFLTAVSGWIGMMIHRAELFAARERDVFERGRQQAGDELAQLTRRQQELAACVAEGLTNEQIADRLVITEGTVANHIAQIMRRLVFTSRTHIAVWAVERGLYRSGQVCDE